jgi:hypothetical protein
MQIEELPYDLSNLLQQQSTPIPPPCSDKQRKRILQSMKVTLIGASDVCRYAVAQALAQHAIQDPPPRVPDLPLSGVGFYGLRFHSDPGIVMCLWDIPGADAYREMGESNVKTSDVVMILADVYDSLADAELWLQHASTVKHTFFRPTVILIGCTIGNTIGKLRKLSNQMLTTTAAKYGAKYKEISVSQSVGFGELITTIFQHDLQPHSREVSPYRGYQNGGTTDFEEVVLHSEAEEDGIESESEKKKNEGVLLRSQQQPRQQNFWSFFEGFQSCLYWLG